MSLTTENKATTEQLYFPTDLEHRANICTHLMAIPVSILGFVLLCVWSNSLTKIVVSIVYGTSLIALFSISTYFHWDFYRNKKRKLQQIDRAVIYVFIAASYLPWLILVDFPHHVWFSSVWIIYLLAIIGVVFELTAYSLDYPVLGVLLYIGVALVPGLAIYWQSRFSGSSELLVCATIYIVGVFFFRSDGKIPFAHAIWHIFVIVGASIHYFTMLAYLYSYTY